MGLDFGSMMPWVPSMDNLINATNTAIGMGVSWINNSRERQNQWNMAQANNDFNARENYLNRIFQSQENDRARDWQSKEWKRQFDLENEYNTPAQQVKRLIAAGINPSAVFGQTGTAVGQTPSMPIASTVGAPPIVGAHNQYIPNYLNPFSGIRDLSAAINEIASASNKNVDTNYLLNTLESRVKGTIAENDIKELDEILLSKWGDKFKSKEYTLLSRQVTKIAADIYEKTLDNDLKEIDLKWSDTFKNVHFEMLGAQGAILKNELMTWWQKYTTNLQNMQADTRLKGAQTSTTIKQGNMFDTQSALNTANALLANQEYNIKKPNEIEAGVASELLKSENGQKYLFDSLANEMLARYHGSEASIENALLDIKRALINQDLAGVDAAIERIGNVAGMASNFMGGLGALKSALSFGKNANTFSRSQDLKEKIWNTESTTHSHTESGEYTVNGRKVKYSRTDNHVPNRNH